MLLSFLYNKTIIDCNQAQNLGTISKIHVNYKKIDYIETSRNVKIDVKNIYQINDAIMYKSEYRNYPNFKFFRVGGQLVTDDKGKIHGRLVDLMITKDFDIKKIITDNKNLLNVEILSISDDGLVFKRMPKAKKKEVKTDKIATVAPAGLVTTICNYGFLIGRITQKNITAGSTIIVPAGKKITKQDIDNVQKHGKLIDLTVYSKFYNIENL